MNRIQKDTPFNWHLRQCVAYCAGPAGRIHGEREPQAPRGQEASAAAAQPAPAAGRKRARAADRAHSAGRCKLLISLAMPVSTINAPMTSATARYADSLRLSVAPMMDWT